MEVTLGENNVKTDGANVLVRSLRVPTSPGCTKPPVAMSHRDITAPSKNQTEAHSAPVDDRVREKGNAGRCTKQASKRMYSKTRKAPCKRKKSEADEPMLKKQKAITLTKVKAINKPK